MVELIVSNLTERIEISDDCSFMRKRKKLLINADSVTQMREK